MHNLSNLNKGSPDEIVLSSTINSYGALDKEEITQGIKRSYSSKEKRTRMRLCFKFYYNRNTRSLCPKLPVYSYLVDRPCTLKSIIESY